MQSGGCYSRLWWEGFVEKVSFEPGIKCECALDGENGEKVD